jgi:hypothetical protein
MSIQEKKDEIVSVLDDLPENTLDHLLELIKEEKHQNNTDESILKDMERRGIIKLPIGRKDGKKIRRTPIEGKGKPASEMIIEDRR